MEVKEKTHATVRAAHKIKSTRADLLSPLLIVLTIVGFLRIVFIYSVNTPNFDDFSYFEYTQRLLNSRNFSSFISELLSKHNGHGVLTAKYVFWLNYIIEGEINFRHLILVSTVFVFFTFAFFLWLLKKNTLPVFYAIPIALLLFNPIYHENILWAAASWQYTASIASCLAMYFLLTRGENWAFYTAILLGFLTSYTNGNGLIGFLLGAVILLPQKKYKHAILWITITLLTGVLYYAYSPGEIVYRDSHKIIPFLTTFISFMATAAYYLRLNMNDLICTGILIAIVFLVVLIRLSFTVFFPTKAGKKGVVLVQQNPANLALLALTAWLFITGLCVAWTREMQQLALVQRYMIYSVLNLVVCYSIILVTSPARYRLAIGLSGILVGIAFQFCAYLYNVPDIINFRNSLWADVYNLKNHGHVSGKVETMNNQICRETFEASLKKGIYVFPEIPIPASNTELATLQKAVLDPSIKFTVSKDTLPNYSGILITSIATAQIAIDESDTSNSIYLALKDKKTDQIHLFAAKPTPNLNRRDFLKNHNHFNPGIIASVYEDNVSPGWYTIGILTLQDKIPTLTFTNKEVEIGKIY